jgi:hypothetical protein
VEPPENVRVRVEKGVAIVEWDPSPTPNIAAYVIMPSHGKTPWEAEPLPMSKLGPETTRFREDRVPGGGITYYRVKAVAKDGRESEPSPIVRAQPRVADDLAATVLAADHVQLTWRNPLPGHLGFHVERAPVEVYSDDQIVRLKKDTPPLEEPVVGAVARIGPFVRLIKGPVSATGFSGGAAFTDQSVDLTKPTKVEGEALYTRSFAKDQIDPAGKPYRFGVYAYRVIAVNSLGVEGGPSAWVLTIPAAVEHVFAKEDGETCHLKWKAMRPQGIAAYRVYRMGGPKLNGPGQTVTRLTPEPVAEAAFTDPKATKETKRYWIVAVDKLGQEGIPSAPAWHWRQFRKYYEPFTGEWHQ